MNLAHVQTKDEVTVYGPYATVMHYDKHNKIVTYCNLQPEHPMFAQMQKLAQQVNQAA